MTLHAITVIGHDRPGIIAETTGRLAALGLNLEDSSMTLLRGHFAMTLICEGTVGADELVAALNLDEALTVTVREVAAEAAVATNGSSWVLTVHGGDRPGIVSAVTAELARYGGNITDLSTRLAGDLYLLVAELDLPAGVDGQAVVVAIDTVAQRLGVAATLRPAEVDEF